MNPNTIALGVCGTFGSPNGFQQCFYQPTPFSRSLDLDSKALEVAPGEPLFMIRCDGDTGAVCLAAYSAAREPQSSRRGTFIGSAIGLPAGRFRAEALSDLIRELHQDVISAPENMVEGVLQVSEAVKLTVAEPHSLKKAEASVQAGPQRRVSVVPGQVALIAGKTENLAAFLDAGLHYFAHFDTLYFTANTDTQQSATQKGLVPVWSWAQFAGEKEAMVQQEKAAAKKLEEAKRPAAKKKPKTASPASETAFFEPWEQTPQWSRSEREKHIEAHNLLLQLYQNLAAQVQQTGNELPLQEEKPRRKRRLNRYKIAFWGLVVAVVCTGGYLLYRGAQQKKADAAATAALLEQQQESMRPLKPAPNAGLDSAGRATLFPQGFRGWSADSVTAQLYAGKPEVAAAWPKMRARYRNALVAANKSCFVGSGNAFYCICDSLALVPVWIQKE